MRLKKGHILERGGIMMLVVDICPIGSTYEARALAYAGIVTGLAVAKLVGMIMG